jgi:RHS repeat-associated protein
MLHLESIPGKWLLTALLITTGTLAIAQPPANKPNAVTQAPAPAGQVATRPADYSVSTPINYIRTWEALGPYQTPQSLVSAGYQHVKESTEYIDGLGRAFQKVARQFSPGATPKDMVTPIVYDAQGREALKYISYVQSNNVTNDGKFKKTAFTDQDYFYKNIYKDASNNLMYAGEQALYTRTEFDPSELNRTSKEFAAGNTWAGSFGSGSEKAVSRLFLLNSGTEDVRYWTIGNNPLTYTNNDVSTNIPIVRSQAYGVGELEKEVRINEQGNASVEYKDKEGKIILKKVQVGNSIPADYSGYTGFLCTYFIYDDFNNLRFVIPPKVVEAIKTTWVIPAASINELCYRYEYDAKTRMIAKKIPGSGWVYMVYDTRDRLVFSQDAIMRDDANPNNNKWMTILYDAINRPVLTGIINYSGTPSALQSAVNTLTQTPAPPVEETAVIEGMTITKNPIPGGATFIALSISYFDNYAWTAKTYTSAYNSTIQACDLPACNNPHPENLPAQSNPNVIGLSTGSKLRVINDPNNLAAGAWISTAIFYDAKDRAIQVQADNINQGTDITTSRYNFTGNVIASYLVHNIPGGTQLRVKTAMEYDHGGRLLETWKIINDDVSKKALIARNEYDEMGQVKRKELGKKKDVNGNYTIAALETLDYTYNIRGWLKGINKYFANSGVTETDRWFGMELNYDWGFGTSQVNGNIAGSKWRSRGDGERRAYGFGYDRTNRIMGGDFSQQNGTSYVDNAAINFDMQMGDGVNASSAYDENGNILAMKQWGVKVNASEMIDNMTYSYFANSNKLSAVTESGSGVTDHKLGDFTDKNVAGNDYGYDKNGNLVTDLNKRANGTSGLDLTTGGAISYNHLNRPYQVGVKNDDGSPRGTITYTYDAIGNKLKKVVVENPSASNGNMTITVTTLYMGSFVHESKTSGATVNYTDKLQYFNQEEGRIRPLYNNIANPVLVTGFAYDYMVKDHLGDVRMVLTDEQQLSQYPALSYEGTAGSAGVIEQDAMWENSSGQSISVNTVRAARPSPFGTVGSNGDYVQLLRKSTGAIGAAKLLKVMSGDRINTRVDYYYTATSADNSGANGLNSVLGSLGNMILNSTSTSPLVKSQASGIATQLGADPGATTFFSPESGGGGAGQPPKAYMHVLLFDERFKFDNVNSFVQQVPYTPNVKGTIDKFAANAVEVKKNGYAYIYISNESNEFVYFDNFLLTHERGPLLEENHYYPFGLIMNGISSKALSPGKPDNKRKYNGIEYEYSFDLNIGETFYRTHDPQLGRWWQVDPKPSESESPYAAMGNNPILNMDPLGDKFVGTDGKKVKLRRRKGQIVIKSKNASADLQKAIRLVNASGSKTAIKTVMKASRNSTKITVKIESRVIANDLYGNHGPADRNGVTLSWNDQTNDFNGRPVYRRGLFGLFRRGVYKAATITIYEGNLREQGGNEDDHETAGRRLTLDELVASTFVHEVGHDTDRKFIRDLRNRRDGRPDKGIGPHDNIDPLDRKVLKEIGQKSP